MATNASNITHNKANGEDWMHLPASHCIPWLVVFSIESLAIVILNAIIIVVFVKQRQLQKKSTYLLIHLAIVDFFVGVVSGPLEIEDVGSMYCDLWKYVDLDFWLAMSKHGIGKNFPQISLFNLAFISLERAHATFRPFKHRFVKKWVYGVMITVVWLVPVVSRFLNGLDSDSKILYVFFSYFFTLLFVILVCYVSIYIKVRHGRLPQHHGATGLRERKLTSTLFLVTFGSLLTFLPTVVFWGVMAFDLLKQEVEDKNEICNRTNANRVPCIYHTKLVGLECQGIPDLTFQGAVGYGLRDCSFVNILPRGSDNLEIIDLEQEKPGAELGPLRNSGGDWASPREAVGGQLDALVSIREKVSHPDFDAVRHVGADDHSDKYLMFDKIKGLAIVK
ncbi:rhodopsin-like [Stylophora pistillata]|uniref:rhodopsin-like n=1 Tax=Stylophora pistillata TaxID=50429 RepID=UPI000C050CF6|nr:rhodopsin-like [Stylophora pistillata]